MPRSKPLRWTRIADRETKAAIEEVIRYYEDQLATAALPTGTIVIWTGTACPAGYSEVTALRGTFPRAVPSGGTVGATGGSDNHAHLISHVPDQTTTFFTGSGTSVTVASQGHGHVNTGTTTTLPPYTDVLYCQKG